MPLYLMNEKGSDTKRLIRAISKSAAEDFYLGKHDIECRTISDATEGAELAAEYPLEKADEPQRDPPAGKPAEDDKTETE